MESKPSLLAKLSKAIDTPKGRRVVIAVTVLLALLLVLRSIKPAMDGSKADQQKSEQISQKNQTTEREIATLTPRLNQQKANNLSGALNTALPKAAVADQQLQVLTRLADQTNVKIPTFEPGEASGEGGSYQFVPVNLSVQGSLENSLRFLGGMRNMVKVKGDKLVAYGPIWQINQISLSPGEGNQVSLTLAAGYYISGASKPPAEGEQ